MAVADEVGPGHESRQAPVGGRLDLAAVLAQLGGDRGEVEPLVERRLGRERLERRQVRGCRVGGVERDQAVLGQAPSALLGPLAEPDVVRRRAREVDEVRAETVGGRGHDVELRALAEREARARRAVDAGLGGVVALVRDRREQPPHRRAGVGRLDEHVEVADRLDPASHRARDRRGTDLRKGLRERHEPLGERLRVAHEQPPRRSLPVLVERLEDARLALGTDAPDATQPSGPRRSLETPRARRCHGSARARPPVRGPTPVSRSIAATPAGISTRSSSSSVDAPGPGELLELVGDALADAGQRRRAPAWYAGTTSTGARAMASAARR